MRSADAAKGISINIANSIRKILFIILLLA
jgi:hypothetical protein